MGRQSLFGDDCSALTVCTVLNLATGHEAQIYTIDSSRDEPDPQNAASLVLSSMQG